MSSDDQAERSLGDSIRQAVVAALRAGPRNVAAAVNVNRHGHRVVVYSEEGVTIVQRDGRTEVVNHADQDGETGASSGQ